MAGIIVQLLLSWIIVWLFEKKNLGILGFWPTKKRITWFFLFFLVTAIFAASGYFMRMYFGERWKLNPDFTWRLFIDGLWYNIKSVLFEELIFRGVLLYILVRRTGVVMAILISSIAFGIYHWFTYELFGNPVQMIIVFFITGIMGALLAYGYVKTLSLYIPCAIHLGWNFTNNFIFSNANIGNGLFIMDKVNHVSTVSYFVYYFVMFFPMVAMWIVNFFLIRKDGTTETQRHGEARRASV